MSMCSVFFCVVGTECLLWLMHSISKTLLDFDLLCFVFQGQICLLLQVSLDFLLLHSNLLYWKVHLFGVLINTAEHAWADFSLTNSKSGLSCCVQLLSCGQLFATPWTSACKAFLSLSISWNLPKFIAIALVMPSNHVIFCRPLLPSIFPSIKLF